MPLRMIGFILALIVLVLFIGLNWENTSNVDLWFNQTAQFEDVSIVKSFLIVYVLGLLSSIPFWIDRSVKKKKKDSAKKLKLKKNTPQEAVEIYAPDTDEDLEVNPEETSDL